MSRSIGHGTRRGRHSRGAVGMGRRDGGQGRSYVSGRVRIIGHGLVRRCRVRRGLAVTEVQGEVVRAGLVDSSGGSCVRAFIYSALHLLEELIDLDKVALSADVGHRG